MNNKLAMKCNETHSVLEQSRAGRHATETEESSQSRILPLELVRFLGLQAHRHSESADEHLGSKSTHLFICLSADRGDDAVVPAPSSSVVQSVSAHEEDFGELFVVVGHHGGPRRFLGHSKQIVDILDGAEGFLPQLEFHGGVELSETCVEVMLKGVWIREIDGMLLVRIFGNVGEMEAEGLAEATEFDFALMFETEFERLLSDLLQKWLREICLEQ